MINLEHLFETLGRSNAGAKLVLMDACRNELKLKGSMRNLSEDSLAMPARVLALLSCGKKQRAYEVDHLKHGLFFHHVLQGLRGKARNPRGEVTWASLTDHVAHEVQAEAKKLDREQTPTTVSGEYAGVSPVLARVTGLPPRPRVDDGRFVTNGLGMKLARVPAGEALVGSPAGEKDRKPDEVRRAVKIPRPFLLGVHEVTQKQFRDVMGYNPSYFSRDGTGRKGGEYPLHQPAGGRDRVEGDADGLPVENVSWDEAREFCEKLSVQPAEKKAGRVYRLPTEAEWEYACRAGTTTAFHVGDSLTKGHANFTQILRRTAPVGNYPANPWGLRDMHGNVAEWCADVYEVKGTARVVRGGNWAFAAGVARSAARQGMPPSFRANAFGFRVAAEAGE